MGKALYIGDDNYKARKVKKIYVGGSDGLAHKVKKIYVGDANGVARLAWSNSALKEIGFNKDTNKMILQTDDFTTYTELSDGTNASAYRQKIQYVINRKGYIYRLNNVYTGTTKTSANAILQCKKVGDPTWTDLYSVSLSSTDTGYFMTYNPYEDAFTFTRVTAFYTAAYNSKNDTGSIAVYTIFGDTINSNSWVYTANSGGWKYVTTSISWTTSYWHESFETFYANGAYYLGMNYYGGSYTYYRTWCCAPNSTNFTILSDSYPRYGYHMLYFNGKYFVSGSSKISYRAYSFSLTSGYNYPQGITEISNTNDKLGNMGDDAGRFFIVNNILYYIVMKYGTNGVNTINIYQSTDGVTFTLYKSDTKTNGFNGIYLSSSTYIGENSESIYYIFSRIMGSYDSRLALVTISKSDFNISYSNTITYPLLIYPYWGGVES